MTTENAPATAAGRALLRELGRLIPNQEWTRPRRDIGPWQYERYTVLDAILAIEAEASSTAQWAFRSAARYVFETHTQPYVSDAERAHAIKRLGVALDATANSAATAAALEPCTWGDCPHHGLFGRHMRQAADARADEPKP